MADLNTVGQVERKVGGLTYSILDPARWSELDPVFRANDAHAPDPSVSVAAVAIDEKGDVVAFHVLQLVYHAEPLWIREDMRGRVEVKELVATLERVFLINDGGGVYFAFAPTPEAEKMCEQNGMKKMPWTVYRKEV